MALGRLTSFTFGNSFLTLVYANSQTYYVSYAHIIAGESDSRSGDLTIWIYTAGEVGETLSVKNSDLVAIGSSATAFLALFNQNIQPYSYWQDFLDSTTASGALPSEPSALRGQCLYARFRPIYNFGSASLINVPARFKAGTLYSQVPDTGAGDFTVTRATTPTAGRSTRINKDGLIELVADNVPRLDYPLGGAVNGCASLLVEPSGQNLVVQSQNWLASGWRSDATANVTTVSATTGTLDPLGTNTANAISPTSGNTSHLKVGSDGSASFTSGTIYTESGFFKQGTGNAGRYIQLTYPATRFTQEGYANFDLQLGTVTVVSGTSADTNRAASIENYGNGWYRCRFTATCNNPGTGNGFSAILITASGSARAPSFAGTTTDVLYGWGAQTETGSVATSYIPTTTAAITRGADLVSKTGVSSLIGQSEGTIYAEVDAVNWTNLGRIFVVSDGTTLNAISILFNTSNRFRLIIDTGGGSAQADISSSSLSNGVHKIAVAYANNDIAFFVDGVLVGTDTSATIPACSQIFLGKIGTSSSTNFMNDRIRAAAIYPNRLTNAQLQTLTTP